MSQNRKTKTYGRGKSSAFINSFPLNQNQAGTLGRIPQDENSINSSIRGGLDGSNDDGVKRKIDSEKSCGEHPNSRPRWASPGERASMLGIRTNSENSSNSIVGSEKLVSEKSSMKRKPALSQ